MCIYTRSLVGLISSTSRMLLPKLKVQFVLIFRKTSIDLNQALPQLN